MSHPAKMSRDLADAVRRVTGIPDRGQVVRAARLEREVVAIRGSLVSSRRPQKRACDHAADGVLAGEDLARAPTGVVELLERDRLLVRGDLEHGVGGRVDDPLARLLVLLAVLLDHLGSRRGPVAEHAAPGAVHEGIDHLVGEAVRIGREGHRRDDAHQLPVPRRRVLAFRPLEQPTRDGRGARLRGAPFERLDITEPERLEIGQVEAPDRTSDVPQRVRAFVSPLGRIWQRTRADGIEHDHTGPRHAGSLRTR